MQRSSRLGRGLVPPLATLTEGTGAFGLLINDAKLFRDWLAGESVAIGGLALKDAFQRFIHASQARNCFWKVCQRARSP